MRRADRLFQIVQLLRRGSLVTARKLAERLEVSERTIYRDVRDLMSSGVPIEGEAGVGYVLRGFDLPPLMFTEDELAALALGARLVERWSDPALARAATEAQNKIEAVLPNRLHHSLERAPLFAPASVRPPPVVFEHMAELRRALRDQRKVRMEYRRGDGVTSHRIVRPLCLAFFAPLWMLAGYCESTRGVPQLPPRSNPEPGARGALRRRDRPDAGGFHSAGHGRRDTDELRRRGLASQPYSLRRPTDARLARLISPATSKATPPT